MRITARILICGALFSGAFAVWAGDFSAADIVFLGEIHDNPAHHAEQARLIENLEPSAYVLEILTSQQAAAVPMAQRDLSEGKEDYGVSHASYVLLYTPDDLAHLRYTLDARTGDWLHDLRQLLREGWRKS